MGESSRALEPCAQNPRDSSIASIKSLFVYMPCTWNGYREDFGVPASPPSVGAVQCVLSVRLTSRAAELRDERGGPVRCRRNVMKGNDGYGIYFTNEWHHPCDEAGRGSEAHGRLVAGDTSTLCRTMTKSYHSTVRVSRSSWISTTIRDAAALRQMKNCAYASRGWQRRSDFQDSRLVARKDSRLHE